MFFKKKINFEEEIKNIYSLLVQNKLQKAHKLLSNLIKAKNFPQALNIDIARIYFDLNNNKSSYYK